MANEQLARYARAAGPLSAGTLTTDTEGLETATVSISSTGFALPAYFARPARDGKAPLLLVIQEIFGVHEHIRDICRRLAKEGYFAIAPELYARQGDVSKLEDIQEIVDQVVRKVPDEQVLADLDATVTWARDTGHVDRDRLGVVGFCWGGRMVWLYSAHQPALKAGAAWYGKLLAGPYSTSAMQPRQPIDVAAGLHGAILGLYGGQDPGIPLVDIAKMRAALAGGGKGDDCEIIVYPEAGHAFNADYRPSYHEASAKDAWARMLRWFDKYQLAPLK